MRTQSLPLSPQVEAILRQPRGIAECGIETITAEQLFSGDFPEPAGIIDKLIYPGVTILQGAPKSGKSYLALQASLDLVNGWPFLSCFRVNGPRSVLYAALEDTKARTAKRLKQLSDPTDRACDLRFVYALEPWPSNLAQLNDLLQITKPSVLIIDTWLALLAGPARAPKNIVQGDYAALKQIQELSKRHGTACWIIDHTKKHSKGLTDTDSGISTTGTMAGVDAILTLRRGDKGTSMLSVLGRDVECNEHELEFDLAKHHGWRLLASGAEAGLTAERRDIVQLLKQHGRLVPKEIAELLGKKGAAVRRLLMKLAEQGVLQCDGGAYYLAPDSLSLPVTEVTGE
jgi:hypothetical protein